MLGIAAGALAMPALEAVTVRHQINVAGRIYDDRNNGYTQVRFTHRDLALEMAGHHGYSLANNGRQARLVAFEWVPGELTLIAIEDGPANNASYYAIGGTFSLDANGIYDGIPFAVPGTDSDPLIPFQGDFLIGFGQAGDVTAGPSIPGPGQYIYANAANGARNISNGGFFIDVTPDGSEVLTDDNYFGMGNFISTGRVVRRAGNTQLTPAGGARGVRVPGAFFNDVFTLNIDFPIEANINFVQRGIDDATFVLIYDNASYENYTPAPIVP